MLIIAVVFCECNSILFALFTNDSEKVEWWKGARSKSYQTIYCVIPGCRGSYWGGKVRLPQRPEVSYKQATPLPLPNRLRQPNTTAIRAFYPRISA